MRRLVLLPERPQIALSYYTQDTRTQVIYEQTPNLSVP